MFSQSKLIYYHTKQNICLISNEIMMPNLIKYDIKSDIIHYGLHNNTLFIPIEIVTLCSKFKTKINEAIPSKKKKVQISFKSKNEKSIFFCLMFNF